MKSPVRIHLAAAFLTALFVRILSIVFFGNALYDTGRMISLYDLAANFAQTGQMCADENFVVKAFMLMNLHEPKINLPYKDLREKLGLPRNLNCRPHITDTWGYAAILGTLWKLTGSKSYLGLQVLQVILDSAAVVALYALMRYLLFGTTAALASAWIYAVFPAFVFMSALPNRDYYAAWGILGSALCAAMARRSSRRLLLWLTAGCWLALTAWVRPTVIFFPFFLAFWTALSIRKQATVHAGAAFITMMLPLVFLFIVPFARQYHERYGTYSFNAGLTGGALWEGLGEFSTKYHFRRNDNIARYRAITLGYPEDAPSWTPEFSAILLEDAMRIIRKDPFFYIHTVARRYFRYFFARPPMPMSEKAQVSYEESGMSIRAFAAAHPLFFIEKIIRRTLAIVIPLLAITALLLFFRRRRMVLLLFLIWQYRIVIGLPIHLEDRYVMESYFAAVALAGAATVRLYQIIKRTWKHNSDRRAVLRGGGCA